MRLADQLIESSLRPGQMGKLYLPFANALKQAVRFEVEDAFGFVVGQIENSGLKKILPAVRFIKPPFATVWFEWVGASRKFNPTENKKLEPADVSSPIPHRMGVLIQVDESFSRGVMSFAWVHKSELVSICPLAITFDWSEFPQKVPDVRRDSEIPGRQEVIKTLRSNSTWVAGCSDDELYSDWLRMGIIPAPYAHEIFKTVSSALGNNPKLYADFIGSALRDLEGEPRFVRCLLLCLNTRNLSRVSDENDLAKLNKARAKIHKQSLLSFSAVKLHFTKTASRKVGNINDKTSLRAHVVMGHHKIRKTGIFWWMPFARGSVKAGIVQRVGYNLDE